MICQDTIDLLGHVSVEAPETSLNVRDRRILLCADDCPCERRIRIAIEEDYVRIDLVNDRFDPLNHRCRLSPMRFGLDAEVVVRFGNSEFLKEDIRKFLVIVLVGVYEYFVTLGSEHS